MSLKISSLQNPRIKFALSLQKASVRKRERLFIVEGLREITLAFHSGYHFHTLFYWPEIIERDISSGNRIGSAELITMISELAPVVETTAGVFAKLAYRENSDGLFAVAYQRELKLEDVKLTIKPLLLVAESIEKPGNLGAILRTADAASVDAVLVCNGTTDIYNPNVIRSSLGTLFTIQVVTCTSDESISWLKEKGVTIFTTSLESTRLYHQVNYNVPAAIVAGAEATGISSIWEENSDANIIIPMLGKADSMNVSVATSIVLYEALRQRDFRR